MKNKKTTFLMLIMGSMIEYYDFVIYLYFAKAIGKNLIPVDNHTANLLITFSIFASTALFRPLGGIIFGYIGDKFSRKLSFTNSILIMSLSTLSIAFIPNTEHIGILATILLIILRLIQSFSVGGEIPAGIIMAYEMSGDKLKALNTNIVIAGTNIGIVVASIIGSFLVDSSDNAWRIPFIIGGVIGLISYAIRKRISDSNTFIDTNAHKSNNPIKVLFTNHRLQILQMLAFALFIASIVSVYSMLLPTYLSTFSGLSLQQSMTINSYSSLIFVAASLIAGICYNLLGKRMLILIILVINILSFYAFNNYSNLDIKNIQILQLIILFLVGIICGRLPVIIASFFPENVRYSGIAVCYNLAFGILGGLSPVLILSLTSFTNIMVIPAIFILIFSIPAIIFFIKVNGKFVTTYDQWR